MHCALVGGFLNARKDSYASTGPRFGHCESALGWQGYPRLWHSLWDHHLGTLRRGEASRLWLPSLSPLPPWSSSDLPHGHPWQWAGIAEGHSRLCCLSEWGLPPPPTLRTEEPPSSVGAAGTWRIGVDGDWVTRLVYLLCQGTPLALLSPPWQPWYGAQGRVVSRPSFLGGDGLGTFLVACENQVFLGSQSSVPTLGLALS